MTKRVTLLPQTTITAALANQVGEVFTGLGGVDDISIEARFNYGSGGTTVKAWVQTSIDGGVSWFDIANFAFTTAAANKLHAVTKNPATPPTAGVAPGDAALADNTVLNGILGDRYRIKWTSTGTYAGLTNLRIDAVFDTD